MKKKLSDAIAESIIQYILDNKLTEGEKLPNETALASAMGVGRNTVREAMKLLVSRNIVRIRQGSGMYVSENAGLSDDPLGLTFIADKVRLAEDLLTVRLLLEPTIAAIAAQNATKNDIRQLKTLHEETSALILSGQDYQEKDAALHTAIAMSSKNLVVPRLIPIIHSTVWLLINLTRAALDKESIIMHGELVRAIEARDPLAAHEAMQLHLLPNRRLIRELNHARDDD